jgi:1-aminocyclopropane-1-carboxylate deaminase
MPMQNLTLSPARVQPVQKKLYQHRKLQVAVLRLDALHPVVSGNKWFKLKGFLAAASEQNIKTIITFGGPYSNHLLATAAACAAMGFSSIGIVRGEQPQQLSATLKDARSFGMQLSFITREAYRKKEVPLPVTENLPAGSWMLVPEGGYGQEGVTGAAEILHGIPITEYTHFLSAVGTGTTLAGLSAAAHPAQSLVGIMVLKNRGTIEAELKSLLPEEKNNIRLLHDFHFGGYAKNTAQLTGFMNQWYRESGIPSDFVYTGKMFYAFDSLAGEGYFPEGSSVLLIHTGGIQGNRSLPNGTLIF